MSFIIVEWIVSVLELGVIWESGVTHSTGTGATAIIGEITLIGFPFSVSETLSTILLSVGVLFRWIDRAEELSSLLLSSGMSAMSTSRLNFSG